MDIDPSLWAQVPAWVLTAFVLAKIIGWLFPILAPSGLKDWWAEVQRSRVHDDTMEEVKLNAHLQSVATNQAQKAYSENLLFDMLSHSMEFHEKLIINQTKVNEAITVDLKAIADELKRVAMTNQRQSDILTTTNINIVELTDIIRGEKRANGAK